MVLYSWIKKHLIPDSVEDEREFVRSVDEVVSEEKLMIVNI